MKKYLFYFLYIVQVSKIIDSACLHDCQYEPNWDSLDKRPIPDWYDKAKVGIFLHWGVYAVPSYGGEWFWASWKGNSTAIVNFMYNNYPPDFTYQDFARDFTAELYNPEQWAKLFKSAGAKYVVLTSKHHEGYTLWPSTYSYSWNSMDVGSHRDLLGELTTAVRNENLRMGVYYSLYEWFNPRYLADKESNFENSDFVDSKMLPELKELIQNYKPEIIWSDGDWEANDTYWKSTEFLAWLYNESPVNDTVLVNDRWGIGIPCKHGDFYVCHDKYNPGVLQPHKWENAMTVDTGSWGYRRNANYYDILTDYELIKTMITTVSCGGNILINVGPTKWGTIVPIFQERLLNLGKWLGINGEAIYETKPWIIQNDTLGQVWYTSKENAVYAISLSWPSNGYINLGSSGSLFMQGTKVELLGYGKLEWAISETSTVQIILPDKAQVLGEWAWVFKISNHYQMAYNKIKNFTKTSTAYTINSILRLL